MGVGAREYDNHIGFKNINFMNQYEPIFSAKIVLAKWVPYLNQTLKSLNITLKVHFGTDIIYFYGKIFSWVSVLTNFKIVEILSLFERVITIIMSNW